MRLILEGIEPGSPRVGAHFDQLRKEYPVRREWASMVFNAERLNLSMKDRLTLTSLGFNLC